MKKLLSYLVVFATLILASCYNDEDIKSRLDALETKIPSTEQQMQAIRQSISQLEATDAKLKEYIASLQEQTGAHQEQISDLMAKDAALEQQITSLRTYVDTQLASTKSWANATFATLERYNALSDDVAALKLAVGNQNTQMNTLISNLESSLKAWVGEQLSNYCTIAEVDAKFAALEATTTAADEQLQNEINALREALATAKTELTTAYQAAISEAIEQNNGVLRGEIAEINSKLTEEITAIRSRLTAIETRLADVEGKVADLLKRIQSVTFIPQFTDRTVSVPMPGTNSYAEFNFMISPKSAVADLATVWQAAISMKAIYTQTRAITFVDMPVVDFEADTANGVITVKASGENLSDEFYISTQDAVAALCISDGNNSITSEYIQIVSDISDDCIIYYTTIIIQGSYSIMTIRPARRYCRIPMQTAKAKSYLMIN